MSNNEKSFWRSSVKTKYVVIFWSAIALLIIGLPLMLSSGDNIQKAPAANTNLSYIPVNAFYDIQGDKFVVSTRVKNTQSYHLEETLKIYVENGVGKKLLIDAAYVDLEPGQTGNLKSAIELSRITPGPFSLSWEWN